MNDQNMSPSAPATTKRPRNLSVSEKSHTPPCDTQPFSQSFSGGQWRNQNPPKPLMGMGNYSDQPLDYYGNAYPNQSSYHQQNFGYPPMNQMLNPPTTGPRPPPNSNYLGRHYDPFHHLKQADPVSQASNRARKPLPPKPTNRNNFKMQLQNAKKTGKYDASELTAQVTIPQNDEWSGFLDPMLVLVAQKMFVVATKALKIDKGISKNRGPAPALTDEEFENELKQATNYHRAGPSSKPS